jgi:hypothetical protein
LRLFFEFHAKKKLWPYYLHTHKKFNVEKDEKMSQMDLPKWWGGGGGQMVETKNHPTLGRLLLNTPRKSL